MTMSDAAAGQAAHEKFLAAFIAEITGVSEELVVPDADLVEDLFIDSVAKIELMVACESRYRIEIPEETINGFRTVRSVLDYLEATGIEP
ncbi:acyl carrier protein [Actinokineospora sp.]|uniref:acyl carrier protein n=1 Tax=Actinokineospora sp. TaxID=1872133 RepID=UPI004037793C